MRTAHFNSNSKLEIISLSLKSLQFYYIQIHHLFFFSLVSFIVNIFWYDQLAVLFRTIILSLSFIASIKSCVIKRILKLLFSIFFINKFWSSFLDLYLKLKMVHLKKQTRIYKTKALANDTLCFIPPLKSFEI